MEHLISPKMLLHAPVPCALSDHLQGSSEAQAVGGAYKPQVRQDISHSGSSVCSHTYPQCCPLGHCCSGNMCSLCLHMILCHEVFSAIQPLLPAPGCVLCRTPGQQGGTVGTGHRASP